MKNREKYRDEIVGYQVRDLCDFRKKKVFPKLGKKGCSGISCPWCDSLFSLWLDGEYEEPPKPDKVDWDNVLVDTLVRVRDSEDEEWRLRYFNRFINGSNAYQYVTWKNGATSKTANKNAEGWKYCELVEDEE